MFARRPQMPQVNKSKWTAFRGFQHGYAALGRRAPLALLHYIFSEQVPPPYESVLRCEKHPGFSLRFSGRLAGHRRKGRIEGKNNQGRIPLRRG
jgi:hypothetical protein